MVSTDPINWTIVRELGRQYMNFEFSEEEYRRLLKNEGLTPAQIRDELRENQRGK